MKPNNDRDLDQVLDNPSGLTDAEARELMSDKRFGEQYRTAVALRAAGYKAAPDAHAAWDDLQKRLAARQRPKRWVRYRVAAALAALFIVGASVATVMIVNHKEPIATATPSAPKDSLTAVPAPVPVTTASPGIADTQAAATDHVIVFDNRPLEEIITAACRHYGLQPVIDNPSTASLRLYFKWDTSTTAQQFVDALQGFDAIDLTLKDNTLTLN